MEDELFWLFKKKSLLIRKPDEEPFELASVATRLEYFDCKFMTLDTR